MNVDYHFTLPNGKQVLQVGPRRYLGGFDVESCDAEDAEFYAIYVGQDDGTWQWLEDRDTRDEALSFAAWYMDGTYPNGYIVEYPVAEVAA